MISTKRLKKTKFNTINVYKLKIKQILKDENS